MDYSYAPSTSKLGARLKQAAKERFRPAAAQLDLLETIPAPAPKVLITTAPGNPPVDDVEHAADQLKTKLDRCISIVRK